MRRLADEVGVHWRRVLQAQESECNGSQDSFMALGRISRPTDRDREDWCLRMQKAEVETKNASRKPCIESQRGSGLDSVLKSATGGGGR